MRSECLSSYSPLSACTICDSSKLRPLSSRNNCQLGCATGFRLVVSHKHTRETNAKGGALSGALCQFADRRSPICGANCECWCLEWWALITFCGQTKQKYYRSNVRKHSSHAAHTLRRLRTGHYNEAPCKYVVFMIAFMIISPNNLNKLFIQNAAAPTPTLVPSTANSCLGPSGRMETIASSCASRATDWRYTTLPSRK